MNDPSHQSKRWNKEDDAVNSETGIVCPVFVRQDGVDQLTTDMSAQMTETDCPLVAMLQNLRHFEAVLTEISVKFSNTLASQVDSKIEWALQQLVELLELDRASIGEVTADGSKFIVTHSYQLPGVPPSSKIIVSSQLPTFSRMIRQGRVVRIPDDLPDDAIPEREYCQQTGLKLNVSIPFIVMSEVVGGMGFTSYRSRHVLPEELIPRLRLVGEIFTNALARKRADQELQANQQSLRQTQQRLEHLTGQLFDAHEEERARIAREMHDDWAPRLAILGMETAKLSKHFDETDEAKELSSAIQEQLVILSEDIHDLSRQLHPSILNDLGLVEALRSECAGISKRHNITIDYRADSAPTNVPMNIRLGIYRVAQEALRNIVKHAGVPKAWVSIATVAQQLHMLICDQGSGFDMETVHFQTGLGLSSMEERIRLIKGELSIESAPGQGTTVEVRVPLPKGMV